MLQRFDERNRNLVVNINGRLVHRDEAGVSPFDSVVQGGDAVWEGLRVYGGRIFRLHQHLDRLHASARALAFERIPTHAHITAEIAKTLRANSMQDGVHIRLTLTRGVKYTSGMDPRLNTAGPTLIVLAEHKPPVYDKTGVTLATAGVRRIPPECLDQKIHSCNLLNSILAKIQATAAGADDALMLDLNGCVAETNATHLFFVERGVTTTPHATSCPEGITRATAFPAAWRTSRWRRCIARTRSSAPERWVRSRRSCASTVARSATATGTGDKAVRRALRGADPHRGRSRRSLRRAGPPAGPRRQVTALGARGC